MKDNFMVLKQPFFFPSLLLPFLFIATVSDISKYFRTQTFIYTCYYLGRSRFLCPQTSRTCKEDEFQLNKRWKVRMKEGSRQGECARRVCRYFSSGRDTQVLQPRREMNIMYVHSSGTIWLFITYICMENDKSSEWLV